MTRRERMEARLSRREEWAESRKRKAAQGIARAHAATDGIPFGQPILVGHHSEKRHRRALDRADAGMRQAVESEAMAARHSSAAANLARALDRTIFSDDPDALDELRARIAKHETLRKWYRDVNAAWRKAKRPGAEDEKAWEMMTNILLAEWNETDPEDVRKRVRRLRLDFAGAESWRVRNGPIESYQMSNLGGRIQTDRKRLADIERQQARTAKAEESGGVTIECSDPTRADVWCRVTFAEKPDRDILNELREAGFRWGAGSWCGPLDKLPESVTDMGKANG